MLPNSGLWVPLWRAEPILNVFRPSDGIQSVMAKKQNPEILCCAYLRGGTHSEWVPPLRWNPICHGKKAEPRNSVLCPSRRGGTHSEWVPPSDGIQSIMAKKQDPEILGCAPLRGGTHSILAYSMPVLSRKIVEYVSSLFFLFFSSPSGVFLSWRAEPILSWQKGGTGKIPNSEWFLSPLMRGERFTAPPPHPIGLIFVQK